MFGSDSLDEIRSDLSYKKESGIEVEDNSLIETSKKEYDADMEQCNKRNILYTRLLSHYLDEHEIKSNNKVKYRSKFFWVTIISFISIIALSIFSMIYVCVNGSTSVSSVSIVVGSVGSMISAIIVLPKIIAEHLFPRNDESAMIELVKNMQLNDASIRKNNKE